MDVRFLDDGDRVNVYTDSGFMLRTTEHGLRDLEFALAQRRSMSRRCPETSGEHTCSLAPGHGQASHLCRACAHTWPRTA